MKDRIRQRGPESGQTRDQPGGMRDALAWAKTIDTRHRHESDQARSDFDLSPLT
jgi:hypothetical protein